jgi:hypothetical protein
LHDQRLASLSRLRRFSGFPKITGRSG